MANNSKIAGTKASASEPGLEAKLTEALDSLYAGQADKARTLLEALGRQAAEAGELVVGRRVRTALAALERKGSQATKVAPAPEDMAIQVHLNRGEAKEALARAEAALKSGTATAPLQYLKALALAQLGEAEAAAEALRQALAMEPALHHQYLLDRDFDGVRAASVFAEFERV